MLKRLIYLLLLMPLACIEPYKVEVPEGEQLLTVEGMITTGPGPHAITLTRSATYGSDFEGLVRPVAGATVIVRDDLGEVTFLEENLEAKGSYFTPEGFMAKVGRSYTLFIETDEGKVYSSFPERTESVPEIGQISVRTISINQEGGANPASGVQLVVEVDDPADQDNFYFWRLEKATYILEARPDLYVTPGDADPPRIPAPKDCCIICFREEIPSNNALFLAVDDSFNGLKTQIPAAFIQDDGLRFVNKYRVGLRQLAISQNAHRFLKLVKQQAEISGSIFDPPPATIRGNMVSLDDPDEVVLGYFIAAGEVSQRIYIDQKDLTFKQNKAIIPDDCRTVPGAVLDPPSDWNP